MKTLTQKGQDTWSFFEDDLRLDLLNSRSKIAGCYAQIILDFRV